MNIDQSLERITGILQDVSDRVAEIETEQDARFQVINRLLIEALGWEHGDIRTEPHSSSGYTDYLVSANNQKRMVIEAKRIGPMLIDTLNPRHRSYKVGGPALASALPGITQAVGYCVDNGVNYAVLTTGLVWIAFLPMPAPGKGYREGLALVFPSDVAILESYAVFYDLFSKEGVLAKTYNLHFAKAGGLSVTEFEPLVSANTSESLRMLTPSRLASDLEPVFRGFFGVISTETDRDMMLECFVETRESRFADASLEKIVRSVSASISELSNSADNQLAREIEHAVSSGYAETIVLVGNNGAGKSTFIERFFDSVLDSSVRNRCTVVRIDLLEATGDPERVADWLTGRIANGLEKLIYGEAGPTYEELQGLYFSEYGRWMRGPFKPLYESDKTAFKVKFSDFLDKQVTNDPHTYVIRLLADIVHNRKKLPCIIFDNCDHFELRFQEAIFQYSQALHKSVPFTLMIMAITDRSLWRLSKAGPFQTYPSKMFYLPVPSTKEVLEKRVAFLRRKIAEGRDMHQYFLRKGIRLSMDNLGAFAACLEEVFIREDFVARRISWLANNNLRRCLELAQKLITSPFFSVEDLVSAYIAVTAHPRFDAG